MRNLFLLTTLSATFALVGVEYALAGGGGMGDPSTVLKEKNAICEMQRRGEGPLTPNMCLPELPVGPGYDDRRNQH
jgi:hypothetical protein